MIDCLRTRVRKQQIIVPYLEFETVLKFYNLEVCALMKMYQTIIYFYKRICHNCSLVPNARECDAIS